jgi:hypothetical protein
VDITVGSALDVFGGQLPYTDVVAWHKQQQAAAKEIESDPVACMYLTTAEVQHLDEPQQQQHIQAAAAAASASSSSSANGAAAPAAASTAGTAEQQQAGSRKRTLGVLQPDGTVLFEDVQRMIAGEAQSDGTVLFRF